MPLVSLVRRVHASIRRTHGTAQVGKAPAVIGELTLMFEHLETKDLTRVFVHEIERC